MSKNEPNQNEKQGPKTAALEETHAGPVAVLPVQGPHTTKYVYRPFNLQSQVTKIAVGGAAYAFEGTQFNPEKQRAEHWLKPIQVEDLAAKMNELLQRGWLEADA